MTKNDITKHVLGYHHDAQMLCGFCYLLVMRAKLGVVHSRDIEISKSNVLMALGRYEPYAKAVNASEQRGFG